jgi:hypothetical protein
LGLLLAGLALAGCGAGGGGGTTAVTVSPLAVRPVNWNPDQTNLGKISAVTDLADAVVVFSDQGMSQLVAGAVSATDGSVVTWTSAGVVPAADGAGQWAVGVDGTGAVYTVDPQVQLEKVSDRWGLLGQHVHAVAATGGRGAAFQLDGQVAVADGTNVTQYALSLTGLAGAGGRLAGISGDGKLHVFDVTSGSDRAFVVPGVAFVTFDAGAKVVAATPHALYGEDADGGITKLLDLSAPVHGLAGAPTGVWVAMGTELGLLTGNTLGASSGAGLAPDASLVASSSGDVWALSKGTLARFSANSPGDESLWEQTVLPVFTQVCSQCHLPGGTANIDLSYYGAWVARRKLIDQRVFQKVPTAMPPSSASVMLTADDLAALKAWIDDRSPTGGAADGGVVDGG